MFIVHLFVVLSASLVLSDTMPFTEPPVDQGDFYRTYNMGQTVHIAWNQSSGLWPTVNLRVGPAFIWNTSYAILLNNAQNDGGFMWTIGQGDNINASLLAVNPKMTFQLNDANNEDTFTLDSKGFIVLAQSGTSLSSANTQTATTASNPTTPPISTATSPVQPSPSPSPSGVSIGLIIGPVIAGVVAIVGIILGARFVKRRARDRERFEQTLVSRKEKFDQEQVSRKEQFDREQGFRRELHERQMQLDQFERDQAAREAQFNQEQALRKEQYNSNKRYTPLEQ